MKRRLLALAITALAVVPAAFADGGVSIAEAPELPLGQTVSGSVARLDFWRVAIVPGDTLRIDYEPVGLNGNSIRLCMMAPSVTDFTLNDSRCISEPNGYDSSSTKRQAVWPFSLPGRYTLVIGHSNCMGPNSGSADCQSRYGFSYNLTAYVVHVTRATVQPVPALAKAGSTLKVRGQIAGAVGGKSALQIRQGRTWTNVSLVNLGADGTFVAPIKLGIAGKYQYRVMYPGDASHKGSVVQFKLTVV